MYYCIYRITNLKINKHYYGYKSSKIHPSKVIGITYFSSSSDKNFLNDQKLNPIDYRYKIVFVFSNSKDALAREVKLHKKFRVSANSNFYNKAIQTAEGFSASGMTAAICTHTNDSIGLVSVNDPRWETGEIIHTNKNRKQTWRKGMIAAVCVISGETLGLVHKTDPRWESGEIISKSKNIDKNKLKQRTKDKFGNTHIVSFNDPRLKTGELVNHAKNIPTNVCAAKTTDGISIGKISTDDPRWESGEIIPAMRGIKKFGTLAKTLNGDYLGFVKFDDPRWATGEIISSKAGVSTPKGAMASRSFKIVVNGISYDSCKIASEAIGVSRAQISMIITGKTQLPYITKNNFTIYSLAKS